MSSPLNGWDARLQPWRYGVPRPVRQVVPHPAALALAMAVLLSGPVAPAPAALGLGMAVTLTAA